jgi:hypothetical protein
MSQLFLVAVPHIAEMSRLWFFLSFVLDRFFSTSVTLERLDGFL